MEMRPVVVWVAALAAVIALALAFHLPERMQCDGGGRYAHCRHGLLSPEAWKGP